MPWARPLRHIVWARSNDACHQSGYYQHSLPIAKQWARLSDAFGGRARGIGILGRKSSVGVSSADPSTPDTLPEEAVSRSIEAAFEMDLPGGDDNGKAATVGESVVDTSGDDCVNPSEDRGIVSFVKLVVDLDAAMF